MTTIIQGDLDDEGKVFNSIKKKLKHHTNEINAAYKHYNKDNLYAGTHIRLLFVAAMMTCGNILELGTDEHSAALFNDILEKDTRYTNKRMVVSAESDQRKLQNYKIQNVVSHQLLHVPHCKGDFLLVILLLGTSFRRFPNQIVYYYQGKLIFLTHISLQYFFKTAGDDDDFDVMKQQCGELCDLEKEVIKEENEFLGSVQSKVNPHHI